MRVQEKFQNVFSYAYGVEKWANKQLPNGPLQYTFVSDFAIADWYGEESVKDTYRRVKKSWINDYKAFTEVVIALNMLSWANHNLVENGFEDRERFVALYSDLYYVAEDDFYEKFTGDDEAIEYFYEMTD